MIRQMPLFPLGTILFPGATLDLHIFEERYRLMISRCLEQQSPFGVVLLREGDEVVEGRGASRPAEPYLIGTSARISANMRLEDGRYLITSVGEERFRIRSIIQRSPYLIGEVESLPDTSTAETARTAHDLRLVYERYWRTIASVTGAHDPAEELANDPIVMSYQLAERLQVTLSRKQHWLEIGLDGRLREITAALRAELALLPPATGRGGAALN